MVRTKSDVSDTSPKWIDREGLGKALGTRLGLGKSRTGTSSTHSQTVGWKFAFCFNIAYAYNMHNMHNIAINIALTVKLNFSVD